MSQIVGFPHWSLAEGPIWYLTWSHGAADKLVIVPFGPREFLLMPCEIILFSSDSAFSTHYSVHESWG